MLTVFLSRVSSDRDLKQENVLRSGADNITSLFNYTVLLAKTGLAPISIWFLQKGKTKEEHTNSKKDRRENKVQDSIDTKHAVSTEDDCHNGHACCCNVARSPDIHCFSPCSQRTHFILLSSIPSSYRAEIKCNAAPY